MTQAASTLEALVRFRAARDTLLCYRTDYATAVSKFQWPDLPVFNWALDHFDDLSRNNLRRALWIVDESGNEVHRTFEDLRAASNRTANFLRGLGVRRGDRLLVMLPNRVELWEVMLAAIKLGAVLSPATMLLSEADLQDRLERGRMDGVIADASVTAKFSGLAQTRVRITVGGAVDGWTHYADCAAASEVLTPDGPTRADDPCVLYFTSGTTTKPKIVLHTQQSYPVGHLSTL